MGDARTKNASVIATWELADVERQFPDSSLEIPNSAEPSRALGRMVIGARWKNGPRFSATSGQVHEFFLF